MIKKENLTVHKTLRLNNRIQFIYYDRTDSELEEVIDGVTVLINNPEWMSDIEEITPNRRVGIDISDHNIQIILLSKDSMGSSILLISKKHADEIFTEDEQKKLNEKKKKKSTTTTTSKKKTTSTSTTKKVKKEASSTTTKTKTTKSKRTSSKKKES